MDIVLVQPEIPWNTGNIGRTCVATQSHLHLIEPLGFSMDDKHVKRAGLDYWEFLEFTIYSSLEEFLTTHKDRLMFLFSRFATKLHWDATYTPNAMLIFGSETKGLPQEFKDQNKENLYRIPTPGKVRSLNLSTSVGVVLFEAIRQLR